MSRRVGAARAPAKRRAGAKQANVWLRKNLLWAKQARGHHLRCTLVAFFTEQPSVDTEAALWRRIFETTPPQARRAAATAFRCAKRVMVERRLA